MDEPVNPQVLLEETTTNEPQGPAIGRSTSGSTSGTVGGSTSGTTSGSTRMSGRPNKGTITSRKFADEDFEKKPGKVRMAKMARNTNPDEDEPRSLHEALNHPTCGKQWEKAVQNELNSLIKNCTWELVRRPHGRTVITNKWDFRHNVRNTDLFPFR
jgi:hypothetical protein